MRERLFCYIQQRLEFYVNIRYNIFIKKSKGGIKHMVEAKLSDITYKEKQLKEREKENLEEKPLMETVIGMGQKITLQRNVIHYWRLEEDLEGIFTLSFRFHKAYLTNNLLYGYSHYQVQKNSDGIPVLVRVPE